jgi:serine phosphatase RsbU (regulator of sigma subunit)
MTLVGQQAARPPAELITACLDDLFAFAGAGARLDDLTLLAIRRLGQAE